MSDIRNLITLVENTQREKLKLEPLPYKKDELDPVLSQDTLDYHWGKLARGYVDRYNAGEGNDDFNEAGAFLHNLYFPQLTIPRSGNKPTGAGLEFVNKHWGNFNAFREEVEKIAMGIQGSGWVYLGRNGQVKTIKNHQVKNDIVLLIDWWEHAWALDYQADKGRYLKNIWRCINWDVINTRLTGE